MLFCFRRRGWSSKTRGNNRTRNTRLSRAAKVDVSKAKGIKLKGYEGAPVLHYKNQGTFHPLKYLAGLVEQIKAQGGPLFAIVP